jgi:hypothetical protein
LLVPDSPYSTLRETLRSKARMVRPECRMWRSCRASLREWQN